MKKWKEKHPIKCFIAQKSLQILVVISSFFLVVGIVLFFIVILRDEYLTNSWKIDVDLAADFGTFFQGLIGTIFGVAGALFVAVSLLYQALLSKKASIENIFFKMVDYHRENVSNIRIKSYKEFTKDNVEKVEGSRAFVLFKLQLFDILKIVQERNESLSEKMSE